MENYKSRIIESTISEKLRSKGAILIEGPKWCGKTTTGEYFAKSVLYMNHPKNKMTNLLLADADPTALLEGEKPRLIDEWQIAPSLWDTIRFEVDHNKMFGQFILTGSAVPFDQSQITHTGTGRFSWIKMRPMSLLESGESSGEVKLSDLFKSPEKIYAKNNLSLKDISFLICRGGWPLATYLTGKEALGQAIDYYDAVVRSDISRVDNVKRNPELVMRLMRSYARNQGSQVGIQTICEDIQTNDIDRISSETIRDYIQALKKIFVIEDALAWNPNLRSKTAIRASDTRYFVDPSIASSALGFGPEDLFEDFNTFGLMFETLAIRDLRVYAESLGGTVYHYKDKSNLECDAVVHLRNGSYGLVEIKLGGEKLIEEGATSLKKLSKKINTDKMKEPSFMMVLTANTDVAYKREDGVYVVPIGILGV